MGGEPVNIFVNRDELTFLKILMDCNKEFEPQEVFQRLREKIADGIERSLMIEHVKEKTNNKDLLLWDDDH